MTTSCRQWLDKLRPNKPYQIHVIEGKALKVLLLNYPEIVQRYFANQYDLLLRDLIKQWVLFDFLPSPEHLFLLAKSLNPFRLKPEELAFLLCAWHAKEAEIDDWLEQESLDETNDRVRLDDFYERLVLVRLEKFAVKGSSVLSSGKIFSTGRSSAWSHPETINLLEEEININRELPLIEIQAPGWRIIFETLKIVRDQMVLRCLYCYLVLSPEKALEVLVEGGITISSSIRLVQSDIQADQEEARRRLHDRF